MQRLVSSSVSSKLSLAAFVVLAFANGLLASTGTVYTFSTPANLIWGGTWYDKARITVDGVQFEIGTVINGNLQNVSSGGHNNSAALHQSTATGGLSFNIERTDGGSFQFYGLWLKYTSTSWADSPFLRIRFYDENNQLIASETHQNNSRNSTSDISRDVRVSRVNVYFAGVLDWWLDNLHVGPPVISPPTVATNPNVNAGETYAAVSGDVVGTGGGEISERGIYWNATPDLHSAEQVAAGSGSGSFQAVISGLDPETSYYAWAYAVNESGTAYGEMVTFSTTDGTAPVVIYPAQEINHDSDSWLVVAPSVHYVGVFDGWHAESVIRFALPALEKEVVEALLRVFVTYQTGNSFVRLWGSYDDSWGTSAAQSPPLDVDLAGPVDVTQTGVWLEFDVTDFVSGRIAGGDDASFVFLGATGSGTDEFGFTGTGGNEADWPSLTVALKSQSDNADLRALAIDPGDLAEPFSPETFTYSATVPHEVESVAVTAEADDEENATVAIAGAGDFEIGLNAITVTVTAENGSTKTYTINVTRLPMLPEVTTAAAGQVDDGSASLGGTVVSDGGGNVTTAGIVWALHEEPDLTNGAETLGAGTGAFVGVVGGLPPGTRIHFRAYAVNEAGPAYGEARSFDTIVRDLRRRPVARRCAEVHF